MKRGKLKLHPTFEEFLKPIRDRGLPIAQRRFYLSREIALTKQANADLDKAGDVEGRKFGEKYLEILKDIAAKEGLKIG